MIVGIDEVGRGPWAGPLVVGAVVLGDIEIPGLTDSKKLTAKRREVLAAEILENAAAVGLGWVHADEIDTLGLAAALQLACQRALQVVDTLGVAYHEIIIDGTINLLKGTAKGKYVTTLAKADLLVASVSAASIVAKVARDAYMAEQDDVYPGYAFGSHAGYGTAKHRAAIEVQGVTPLHRLSFAPLAKYRDAQVAGPVSDGGSVTTKQTGDRAENVVADHLCDKGHRILERNWKTKFCEIDIVSQKGDTVYFTEVKYRHGVSQGGGLAAITPKKLRQMKFAAEFFSLRHGHGEENLRLAAADVSGDDFRLDSWFEVD